MLQPGTQIGRYEIQRRLGRGGMGTVYVAHDPVLGRMVAIKVFLSDLDMPDATERFTREARSAAALNHANIVTIHDFGDWQSQPYIVMEYVQGETLAEIIRRKAPVPASDKLRLVEELCAGVAYAHQVGVIHRDIKPTNLMVDRGGRLKVLDFGIAKMLGTLGSNATALIGTPGYMAPEQIVGGTIDHRSDLFSIAVVCYELLTYSEAFPGETVHAITHRIISDDPVPLGQLLPDASPDLVAVVERGLKKNAADRFADAESFRQAISRVRRQLDSGPDWNAAAAPARGVAPPAGGTIQHGTGSARRNVSDAVGVAELTPPPDPRKTDREALARRRAAQIEAALELARLALQKEDLDQALDACQQALTLDDSHQPALELEQVIKGAMARRRAGELVADAREELAKGALTAAQDLLQQARALHADTPDAKRVERDLKLARIEQERQRQRTDAVQKALAAARSALERAEVEAALTFARQALDLSPDSEDACALEAEALRRLDEDLVGSTPPATVVAGAPAMDKTILAPPRRTPPPAPAPAAHPAPDKPGTKRRPAVAAAPKPVDAPRKDPFIALRQIAASVQTTVNATPQKQKLAIGGVAAGLVVVAIVAAIVLTRAPAVVPTGTLVIDAVPWATIVGIQAADGTNRPLPNPSSTPLSLNLPIGMYQVRVAGPNPGTEPRVLSVEVREGAVTATAVERFDTLTPEGYFEEYLATPAPAAESPTAAEPAAPETPAEPPASPPAAQRPPGAGL